MKTACPRCGRFHDRELYSARLTCPACPAEPQGTRLPACEDCAAPATLWHQRKRVCHNCWNRHQDRTPALFTADDHDCWNYDPTIPTDHIYELATD